MALASNALTTVATVGAELNLSSDEQTALLARLERLINAFSEAIEQHCNRVFYRATWTETFPGKGGNKLLLAHTPIVSVTSVTYDGTVLDVTEYSTESASAGILHFPNGLNWDCASIDTTAGGQPLPGTEEALYVVVYVGGYYLPSSGSRNLPYDVEQACVLAVCNAFRNAGKYTNLHQETDATGQQTWSGYALSSEVKALLKPYVRPSFG